MKVNCIFCKIVRGDIPAFKVYEDNYTMAFLDIAPVQPGHVLVIPKLHFVNLDDIDEVMLSYMVRTAQKVGLAMKKALGVKAYNVVINNGGEAGQLIDHCHVHLIPRHAKDGLVSWPQGKYTDGEASRLAAKIKDKIKIC